MDAIQSLVDREFLFGILALQNALVSHDELVAGMNLWALAKQTPLGDILLRRQSLDAEARALLEALVEKQLTKHQGDIAGSIASFGSLPTAREAFAKIDDEQIRSAALSMSANQPVAPATQPFFGAKSDALGRYIIIRPHAAGGLGEVFVAKDMELDREVSLKQIKEAYSSNVQQQARFFDRASDLDDGRERAAIRKQRDAALAKKAARDRSKSEQAKKAKSDSPASKSEATSSARR